MLRLKSRCAVCSLTITSHKVIGKRDHCVDQSVQSACACFALFCRECWSAYRCISSELFSNVTFLNVKLILFWPISVLFCRCACNRHHVFAYQMYPVGMSDMRLIDGKVSTTWCQQQVVRANTTFNAFLLPETPNVAKDRIHVNMIRWGDYSKRRFRFVIKIYLNFELEFCVWQTFRAERRHEGILGLLSAQRFNGHRFDLCTVSRMSFSVFAKSKWFSICLVCLFSK